MHPCKHAQKQAVHKHTKSKILISLLAMALVCCVSISGTWAWMMRQTAPVVNTFTYGDINIALEETGAQNGTNQYSMVPGIAITKDPAITVLANSENCWLFAKLEESTNFGDYLTYSTEEGWAPLPQQTTTGGAYVYYRTVAQHSADRTFAVLKDNTVNVKHSVTKEMLQQLDETGAYPTLTVTAYAVQQEGVADGITDSAEQALYAWELIKTQ